MSLEPDTGGGGGIPPEKESFGVGLLSACFEGVFGADVEGGGG